jgi:hypothetical protein
MTVVIKKIYSPLKVQKIKNKFYKCSRNIPKLPRGSFKGITLLNLMKKLKFLANLYK